MITSLFKRQSPVVEAQNQSPAQIKDTLRAARMWASVAVLTPTFASAVLGAFPVARALDKERKSLHDMARWWAKSIVGFNWEWNFRILGKENLPKDGKPVVFVANHQSQADIIAVFLMDTQFRWLAKDSLFKIPLFGWAMRAVGYVPVARGNRESHRKCMEEAREHLQNGVSMFFFPEGTRSPDGRLQEFKSGAFRLAMDAGVPVVPITIVGCDTLMRKHSWIPTPAEVYVHIHPEIPTQGVDLDALMQKTRKSIESALPPVV